MTTPAMDSTGVTGESSGSAETSPPPSAPSEINKSDSESQRSSTLPPYFRSYEAYIEHCVAQVGREEIPETAFDRLCASCTAMFKEAAEMSDLNGDCRRVPFCTVNEFLRSAAEGNCHVCHWLMAEILSGRGHDTTVMTSPRFISESLESDLNWLEQGDAALTIDIWPGTVMNVLASRRVFGPPRTSTWVDYENVIKDRGRPTALTTAGDASWNQVLKWIENCRSHPLCNPVQTANAQVKWPARLVAVGSVGDAQVRICETSRLGFVERSYMTLSHCWGKNGVPTRLMEENYATFLNGIQLGELPKTFRDAIDVTRRLNIPFIWIDSLCIIQNSYDDWIQESAKMKQVYQDSFLNLAAGASANSNGGLFRQRHPLSVVPWSVRLGENGYLTAGYISEYFNDRYANLILYTRGWVLQEQLLARRTLVFGQNELHWECTTCQASESFPDSLYRPRNQLQPHENINRPDWHDLLGGELTDSKRQEAWNRLIKTYFKRSLTQASDRLMAISGLAEQLSSRWSGITYLAGLWSYRLISGLLWCCEPPCSQRNTEIAPSWTITPRSVDVLAEVLEASVTPQNRTNPFGPVAFGGSIKLRSPVLRAGMTSHPKKSVYWSLKSVNGHNLDALGLENISIYVLWDEVNDVKADVQDAYLVPFMVDGDDSNLAILAGLILLKTAVHSCKPQFRRAGYFHFSEHFHITDNDYVHGIDDGHNETSQDRVDSTTENAVFENRNSHSDEGINTVQESIHQEPKKKSLFRDIKSWFAKKVRDGLEERMGYLKKDPYVNGPPLNTTLENRYLTGSGIEALPEISRFLEAIAQVAKKNKANGTPDPVLGFGEGNGYYTYEIV
ncbi:heterokaryon incompatibility protein-domain-containing protein [Neurospora crassa]|nr:heterokaryon incompatibility protein-domain-containing protein [Neurospora crassa]